MLRSQRPRVYVANGSRYQAKISYSFYGPDLLCENIQSTTSSLEAEHGERGSSPPVGYPYKESIVNVSIGEIMSLPRSVAKIDIELMGDESKSQTIPRDAIDDDGHDTSIIISEEGSIHYGSKDYSALNDNWMWISKQNGTDHRPRKYFIANASGRKITVSGDRIPYSNEVVHLENKESATVEYEYVRISFEDDSEISRGPIKPRTSIVVCSGLQLEMTGQLYGNDIKEEKWTVDGMSYKATPFLSRMSTFSTTSSTSITALGTAFNNLMYSTQSAIMVLFLVCILIVCLYCLNKLELIFSNVMSVFSFFHGNRS